VADPGLPVIVFSDFICPFCNVARERAAWLRDEHGATVDWLPFHLHPEYPAEGLPRVALARMYGDNFEEPVRRLSEEAGLPYAPHPDVVPNSRTALELGEWARDAGQEPYERLHERIMDAYWAEGRDITGWDVLAPLVAQVGLDAGEARTSVEAGRHAEAVDASTQWAQSRGITAVPAFVLGGRVLVSGAQPHEAFERALERLAAVRAEEASSAS